MNITRYKTPVLRHFSASEQFAEDALVVSALMQEGRVENITITTPSRTMSLEEVSKLTAILRSVEVEVGAVRAGRVWRIYMRDAMAGPWVALHDHLTEEESISMLRTLNREHPGIQLTRVDGFAEYPHPSTYDTKLFKDQF